MATLRLPPRRPQLGRVPTPATPAPARPEPARPAPARPARPAPVSPPLRPEVVVVTGARARAEAILAELEQLKAQWAAMVHRVGTLLGALDDPDILAAMGCVRWDQLLVQCGLPPKPTALRYVAIAKRFTEAQAAQLGTEKAYAVVRYLDVVADTTTPAQLLRTNPRIAGKALLDHSPSSLLDVVRARIDAERARREGEADTAAEADAAVRKLGPRLRKAGAATESLRRVGRGARCRVRVDLDPDEALVLAQFLLDAERAKKRTRG